MKIKYEIELKSFSVPNFVIPVAKPGQRQDGFHPREGIPLSEIDADVLWRLCREFTDAVFKKAGKHQPPTTC